MLSQFRFGDLLRFGVSRRGNFAAITALVAVPLFMAVGTAVDYGNMVRIRSTLQSALDAATMQIALEVNSGKSDAELQSFGDDVLLANLNGYIGANDNPPAFSYDGLSTASDGTQTVSASVSYNYKLMIIGSVHPIDSLTMSVSAKSKVRWGNGDKICVMALSGSASRALDITGSSSVDLDGCVLISKSTDSQSIYVGGSASVNAECAEAAGSISSSGGLSTDCSSNKEGAMTPTDKFASYAYPSKPMSLSSNPKKSDTTLSPGRYKNLSLDGTKTLAAGTYYIEGSLTIQGDISGSGVTFFMADGDVKVNGTASLDLSGPTSGTYEGMIFFAAQDNTSGMTFNGSGALNIDGIIYSPKGNVTFSGSNMTSANCMRIIADTVDLSGNSNMRSDCDTVLGDNEFYSVGQLYFAE